MERVNTIQKNTVQEAVRKRSPYMHKGNCGRVLIIAGGAGMTGAACFTSRAAMRSGTGLAYLCTPRANYPVVQTLAPEVICVDWTEAQERLLGKRGEWQYDAIAFGPGMGDGISTRRMLKSVLLAFEGPVVLDADGLNVLAASDELREFARVYRGELILTPHVGEARRLLADRAMDHAMSREDMVQALAETYHAIALLKGAGTLVARGTSDPENPVEIWRNSTGNPGMATAGSGDVLTGVIASLCGQGLTPWDAAKAGVFIHGLAGDIACSDKGEYGMIASDIVEALPYAFQDIVNSIN